MHGYNNINWLQYTRQIIIYDCFALCVTFILHIQLRGHITPPCFKSKAYIYTFPNITSYDKIQLNTLINCQSCNNNQLYIGTYEIDYRIL